MWAALLSWIPGIVVQVLAFLGISLVFYQGADFALDYVISLVQSYMAGIPADVLAILSLMGVDEAISMILSAWAARAAIRAAQNSWGFRRAT